MPETRALVCGHVFRSERPVTLVIRHLDGEWQLTCGEHDHLADCEDFEVVGFRHLTARQANLTQIGELECGWLAQWVLGEWIRCRHDD
ncbi:hypothetical protein SAMN05428953_13128 [Mesorhizobium muleiense]|uniref:Uncharacterized protein n=1 Tax=Mesorhizobium muleiense TaxID=1004279 RepID=A0A1G9IPZ2_9HYPH|nr:hypothetical protein SAMN05428953_13128 [Mesorhizobium muleiense]